MPGPTGDLTLYLPLAEGESLEAVQAESAEAGLEQVKKKYPGYALTCAPELEAAAVSAAYRVVPYSELSARNCANAAVGIALKGKIDSEDIHPAELLTFLEQASHFWKSPARQAWPSSKLLSLKITGNISGSDLREDYECLIAPDPRPEIVLLYTHGTAQELLEHWLGKRPNEPDTLSRDGARFEKSAPYAIEALSRAWGLEALPTPYCIAGGSRALVNGRVLLVVAGALWASAWLDPSRPAEQIEKELVDALGSRIVVRVAPAGEIALPK